MLFMCKASVIGPLLTLVLTLRLSWYASSVSLQFSSLNASWTHSDQVDSRVFVSGQIGMIPRDLSLPSPRSLTLEAALCMQHADRIAHALSESSGRWTGYSQLIVFWLSDEKHFDTVSRMHSKLQKVKPSLVHISGPHDRALGNRRTRGRRLRGRKEHS